MPLETPDGAPDIDAPLAGAIERATRWLLDRQAEAGYWCGELESDTTLESDYVLYLHVVGDTSRVPRLAALIRRRQLPDGGWDIYDGGPSEINATVKAYLALKLAGDAPDAPHMRLARQRVHALGGLERTNSFARFYLAMVGAIAWDVMPAVPPELVILPAWCWLNVSRMSSWTRAIVIPMSIVYALRPARLAVPRAKIDELLLNAPAPRDAAAGPGSALVSWRTVFVALDRVMTLYERLPWKPFRRRALAAASRWMLDHLERSDGLGAIYPAMMNSVFALMALGHPPDHPLTSRAIRELAKLEIEDDTGIRVQPCRSPVWDTALVVVALRAAGVPPDHPALVRAAGWLLDRQILEPGDWRAANPTLAPGGWAFEFNNDFFPDVDDTAAVLMALRAVRHPDQVRVDEAIRRGLAWMIGMQNRDGGWGAFDRDNDHAILTQVPFADHNAMIDPSTADVTARVLECLAHFGRTADDPVVARGLAYLRGEQTPDAAWYGRWGVNYLYGTSGVLRAAEALGIAGTDWCLRAAAWLRTVQNGDGGFGETCDSYADTSRKGRGPSTPSQTAWAIIGLLGSAGTSDPALARAVQHLIVSQQPGGSWEENVPTGTGFPRVFYLKYHLYRQTFPLYALARARALGVRCVEQELAALVLA